MRFDAKRVLYRHGGFETTGLRLAREQPPCGFRLPGRGFASVNAKQLDQPGFQPDPSRCESGHGCHGPQGVRECARLLAKQEDRGASPRGGTTLLVIMM